MRQKIFDGKSWYSPPVLSINIFATGNFLKRCTKGLLYEMFRYCETKFRLKIVICPLFLSINFFRYQKISGKQKGSFTNFSFRSCETKSSDKAVMPPPLLCMKIFDKWIFLKHQSVLQWNISVQWDKNFDGKSWYSPPRPNPNFFNTRNYCNRKGFPPPYGNFRHCETKFWTKSRA